MYSLFLTLLLMWMAAAQVPVPTATSSCKIGWNLNLKYMKKPMSSKQAVDTLKGFLPCLCAVKLFDYDADLIAQLRNSGIKELVVGIPNNEIKSVIENGAADNIVGGLQNVVQKGIKVTIAIGNEPTLARYGKDYYPKLEQALEIVRKALDNKGLNSVRLTVPFDASILGNSYPPQAGTIKDDFQDSVMKVAQFLMKDGSPFFVNLYPYFAYVANPVDISLQYATLQTDIVADNVYYPNMLAAMLAAVRAGLVALDPQLTEQNLPIIVGETGWPTSGETHATLDNSRTFLQNAINSGIPMYLFEAFDEEEKANGSGSGSGTSDSTEGSYGWITEAGYKKFPLNFPSCSPVVPCDNKYPDDQGERIKLDCPWGTLLTWLENGECIKDDKCGGIIECPKKTKYSVLEYCKRLAPTPNP